ncbi:MAG TPA: thioredoxin domain-containing protein [Longimicrobium sp.]|jgi:protein-disulfide isomerase
MRKALVTNALTGILVVCAVIITTAVVRREFFPSARAATTSGGLPQPAPVKDWQTLSSAGRLIGSPDAPFKLVEFSDYQCPFCKTLNTTIVDLQKKYPGRVAVVYRHLPLKGHAHAVAAAAAVECAGEQGRFEPLNHLLFERQDSIGVTPWEKLAHEAGVPDTTRFRVCRGEPRIQKRIDEDMAAAKSAGFTGTPTLVIRDKSVTAAVPLDTLERWIERADPTALKR